MEWEGIESKEIGFSKNESKRSFVVKSGEINVEEIGENFWNDF